MHKRRMTSLPIYVSAHLSAYLSGRETQSCLCSAMWKHIGLTLHIKKKKDWRFHRRGVRCVSLSRWSCARTVHATAGTLKHATCHRSHADWVATSTGHLNDITWVAWKHFVFINQTTLNLLFIVQWRMRPLFSHIFYTVMQPCNLVLCTSLLTFRKYIQ